MQAMWQRKVQIWWELFILLVQKELRVRYRGSSLGYLWSMMNPLLYMLILTFIFSHIVRFEVSNFPLFILSGIMTWNLFQQSLAMGVHSIVTNGALLRKVRVPAAVFPAACIGSVLVNFSLSFLPFFFIALYMHHPLGLAILFLPFVLIPFLAFIYGATLVVASLNVKFRDIGHVIEPILMLVFYATPILYPREALPEVYRPFLNCNPMVFFVTVMRDLLLNNRLPAFSDMLVVYILAACMLAIGLKVYTRLRPRFIFDL